MLIVLKITCGLILGPSSPQTPIVFILFWIFSMNEAKHLRPLQPSLAQLPTQTVTYSLDCVGLRNDRFIVYLMFSNRIKYLKLEKSIL